jgi:hypothetical protein
MKINNDDRSTLLEALFPSESAADPRADDVIRWIEADRRTRQRRLWYSSATAALLVFAVSAITMFVRHEPSAAIARVGPGAASEPVRVPSAEPPRSLVERVDDEDLMGSLDDMPAALVQWPDGRRSLLVVVRQPE